MADAFLWDWHDQTPTSPAPKAPGTQAGAPTTMAEWETFFFGLIGKSKGAEANDWQAVLNDLKAQGMKVNPAPGEIPQTSWKFFGMSVMIDGSGNPRGRIWLPTATAVAPPPNDFYTHEIQVIAGGGETGTGGSPGGGGTGGAVIVTGGTFGDATYPPLLTPRTQPRVLNSTASFSVAAAAETVVTLAIQVGALTEPRGRLVHPILGAFDYETKPDEWVNIDQDAIVAPIWATSRTLTNAANVLWEGKLRDVVVEERWKALGGLSMPITQLRMLLAIWTNPIDPDVGYVHWHPNYITQQVFKVLPISLSAGGQGLTFDDVVNYKDEDGGPIGWMTSPVTFTLKIVEKIEIAVPTPLSRRSKR